MSTFHGVRQLGNIVHNAKPVDSHEPWVFLFQYTWLLDAYDKKVDFFVAGKHGLIGFILPENEPTEQEWLEFQEDIAEIVIKSLMRQQKKSTVRDLHEMVHTPKS